MDRFSSTTVSPGLWILAAIFFFVPTGLVIVELSTRFPEEGGLYAWSKAAFGEFHGFVAGWTYWVYTLFYFPALLFASASMAAYIGGIGYAPLAQNRTFLLIGPVRCAFVAVFMNIIGLRIGKWLQNAGGVSTFSSTDDLDCGGCIHLAPARLGDAIHLEQHPSALGLGDRKFLAADCFCVCGSRACVVNE